MRKITLYTRLECSLCDQAYKVLLDVALDTALAIDVVDISHAHTGLESQYATRIPVAALDNGLEVNWPFSAQELLKQLQ
jgi:hypothetical protein